MSTSEGVEGNVADFQDKYPGTAKENGNHTRTQVHTESKERK